MKLTKIRNKDGKLDSFNLQVVCNALKRSLECYHFITEVTPVNSQYIKIGLHMRSFKIDVKAIGYNARRTPFDSKYKLGYRRTDTPTWNQRVQFNDIVNAVLNSLGIFCNIKSGSYTIRYGGIAFNESDWLKQIPEWQKHNENRGYRTETIEKEI